MWIEWSEEQAVAGVVPQISRLVLEVGDICWFISKLSFLQLDDLDSHVGILPLRCSRFGQNIQFSFVCLEVKRTSRSSKWLLEMIRSRRVLLLLVLRHHLLRKFNSKWSCVSDQTCVAASGSVEASIMSSTVSSKSQLSSSGPILTTATAIWSYSWWAVQTGTEASTETWHSLTVW